MPVHRVKGGWKYGQTGKVYKNKAGAVKQEEGREEDKMNLASDLLDKYTPEQVTAYLNKLSAGILKNYQTAIKLNQPQILFGSLGDVAQLRDILYEMNKRNQEREALKNS